MKLREELILMKQRLSNAGYKFLQNDDPLKLVVDFKSVNISPYRAEDYLKWHDIFIEMNDGQGEPFPHRPREGRLPRAPVPQNEHSLVRKFHFFLPPPARAAPLSRRGRANFQTAYLTMMSFFFARVMAVYSQRELSSKKRDSSKTMTKSYSDPCALWQVTA